MILKEYRIDGLHEYIEVDLALNKDLSIILGGNGEGKTSALNLLAHVLRFNINEISILPFKHAVIVYSDTDHASDCTLEVTKKGDQAAFKFTKAGVVTTATLNQEDLFTGTFGGKIVFTVDGKIIESRTATKSSRNLRDIRRAVTSAANLTFVKLDRTITALDPAGAVAREILQDEPKASAKKTVRDPLEVVQAVVSAKYLEYRNAAESINLAAQQQSFDLHFAIGTERSATKLDLDTLDSALRRLTTAWSDSAFASTTRQKPFEDFVKRISSLSGDARAILQEKRKGRRTAAEDTKLIIASEYSRKADSLATLLETQNKETTVALRALAKYIEEVNDFFKDSGKCLFLSSIDNTLYFRRLGKNEKPKYMEPVKGNPLSGLSSGERQILILLTYLAFSGEADGRSIFLVDEPELSLHLRWQAKLIPAMRRLSPTGCQIIMATHAPEIAGRAREKCIPLNRAKLARGK